MGVKVEEKDKRVVPGPGEYGVGGIIGGPKFGFGTESRSKDKKDNSPGPGHYKVPVKVADVPRYSLPNHPEEHRFV